MYSLINSHIDRLLQTISPQDDVRPYVQLVRDLPNVDASQDMLFQRTYRRYWALNAARLGPEFLRAYFAVLERSKQSPERVTAELVARELLEIPVNSKGTKSLQFSFASKLVHMVNPRLPVYDSMVETFFFFPRPDRGTTEKKLANLLQSYKFLVEEYDRVLRDRLLSPAIDAFRQHFRMETDYSDEKIIDTLIWRFVSFLWNGALRDRTVVYR
jgi:hypothetical protein